MRKHGQGIPEYLILFALVAFLVAGALKGYGMTYGGAGSGAGIQGSCDDVSRANLDSADKVVRISQELNEAFRQCETEHGREYCDNLLD